MGDLNGLILDLRQNPGGLLSEGVGVADKFLRKGQVIVSHRGRNSPEKVYHATHGNGGKEYPLVVLVNRGTRLGGGDRRRSHSGSRPRPDRGRDDLRQRAGADGLSAFGKHRPGPDYRQVLHAQRAADPARLQRRFALRLLLRPRRAAAPKTMMANRVKSS